jgi:hypothetical protein
MKYYSFVVGVAYGGADDVLGTGVSVCESVRVCRLAALQVKDAVDSVRRGLASKATLRFALLVEVQSKACEQPGTRSRVSHLACLVCRGAFACGCVNFCWRGGQQ